jgi:two-component system, NarL family, response regulator NreC
VEKPRPILAATRMPAPPRKHEDAGMVGGISPTRVLLVDDHRLLRAGLRMIIERASDMECVAEAGSVAQAGELLETVGADIVLMDIEMPGVDGISGIAEVHRRCPGARVVMLSMHGSSRTIRAAFAAGAHGYLVKTVDDDELLGALRAVARGERYVDPSRGAAFAQPPGGDPLGALTDRERQIMQLLALGYSNHEIAERLTLSPRTIESHRAHVMNKLGANTRAEMVRIALNADMLARR